MAKRRISMFEAFGATSSKGSAKGSIGPQAPQRTETQRAIDAQRGLDPREPRGESSVPSAEVLRALHTQFEAELAAARRAPRVEPEPTRSAADAGSTSAEPEVPSPAGAADEEHARLFRPAQPARRTLPADSEPRAPEGGFVLPFGWVTFLCLQLGLFAVAFGLGALTAGGGPPPGAGAGTDLQLDEAVGEAPGNSPGKLASGQRAPQQPTRPPVDPEGVRGSKPTPQAGAAPGGDTEAGSDDPFLLAFLDPANHFSLQVASYDGSPNGQGMARHWQAFLRQRQFPAVLRQVGTRLGLFVGASPNSLAIEELEKRVLALRDERNAPIFTSPRVVNLRDYR